MALKVETTGKHIKSLFSDVFKIWRLSQSSQNHRHSPAIRVNSLIRGAGLMHLVEPWTLCFALYFRQIQVGPLIDSVSVSPFLRNARLATTTSKEESVERFQISIGPKGPVINLAAGRRFQIFVLKIIPNFDPKSQIIILKGYKNM